MYFYAGFKNSSKKIFAFVTETLVEELKKAVEMLTAFLDLSKFHSCFC